MRNFFPRPHADLLGLDVARDGGRRRDDERGAMQISLDLAVDLDQALGRDAADNLQSFGDNRALTSESEHDPLLTRNNEKSPRDPPGIILRPNSWRHCAGGVGIWGRMVPNRGG